MTTKSSPEDTIITIKADIRPDQKELQDALRGLRVTRHILPGYGEETARLWNWIEAALAYAAGEYHWGNDHFRRLVEAGRIERERVNAGIKRDDPHTDYAPS